MKDPVNPNTLDEVKQKVNASELSDIAYYIWKLLCRIWELEYVNSLRCRKCKREDKFWAYNQKPAQDMWEFTGRVRRAYEKDGLYKRMMAKIKH